MAAKPKAIMKERVALGFRSHSGWAAVLAVSGWPGEAVILGRSRIEIADPAIPGSKQPYHAAERLGIERADALIRRCRESSTRLAVRAVGTLVDQLGQNALTVVGVGILLASGRPLPDLAAILRSHALIHTAEGEFFREVLARASEHHSLPVTKLKERDAWDQAARVFRMPVAALHERIEELGKSLGPPWRQDEKLASLAGWTALAESRSHSLMNEA